MTKWTNFKQRFKARITGPKTQAELKRKIAERNRNFDDNWHNLREGDND